MKASKVKRIETAARFPQKAAAPSDLVSPASIVHHITPSSAGAHTITTTVTTTVTGSHATGKTAGYLPTVERFTLRSPQVDPPASAEEAAAMARLLDNVEVSRNANARQAVQMAKAYANHE